VYNGIHEAQRGGTAAEKAAALEAAGVRVAHAPEEVPGLARGR